MHYLFGEFTLDLDRFELRRGRRVVPVEPQVFDVLRYLVEHRDRVVAKEELLDAVWHTRAVTESTLTSRIKVARRALGDDGASQSYIRTVRGRGFQFLAEVVAPNSPTPPGRAPSATAPEGRAGTLPQPVSRVVGREDVIADICRTLRRERLVTVLGPGGVGKTTVALCVGDRETQHHPDGVFWCDWSSVTDGESALQALADAIGTIRQPGTTVEESILQGVGARRVLLVADNCEHLLDAVAPLLHTLVSRCRRLTVLATSRSPLSVPGETLHPLRPLAVAAADGAPDVADGPNPPPSPAARLFLDRARAAAPDVGLDAGQRDAVEGLCRRLDGLPLAIELAAPRLRAVTLDELATELDEHLGPQLAAGRGRAPRHRTLAETVRWSYGLLAPEHQRLFKRLAVFAGGFGARDAALLLDLLGDPADDVIPGLAALVDQSMVTADRTGEETRYLLLETLRRFALEQASAEEVHRARAAHLQWAVHVASALDDAVCGPDEPAAVRGFSRCFPDLRAAVHHAVRHGDLDAAMRLASHLHLYAVHRLRDEVFTWVEDICAMPGAPGHRLYPCLLGSLAQGLANRGELTRAAEVADSALSSSQETDERHLWALHTLSNIALYKGRLAESTDYARREVSIANQAGDTAHEAYAYVSHVLAEAYAGRVDRALEYSDVEGRLADRSGSLTQTAWSAYGRGEALAPARPQEAHILFDRALRAAGPVDSQFVAGVAMVSLASAQARLGRPGEALLTLSTIVEHWYRCGDWTHQWTTLRNVALLLHQLERHADAARLLGACTSPGRGAPPFGETAAQIAQTCAELDERLGSAEAATLLMAGAAMAPEEIVDDVRRSIAAAVASVDPA